MKNPLAALILMTAVVVAVPLAAHAQPAMKVFRVGYLGLEPAPSPYLEALRDGLRRLGYSRDGTSRSRVVWRRGKRTGSPP